MGSCNSKKKVGDMKRWQTWLICIGTAYIFGMQAHLHDKLWLPILSAQLILLTWSICDVESHDDSISGQHEGGK